MTILLEHKKLIDNCLQNFLELSSSERNTYIFYLLDSLANQEGVALEYSGVYLDTDPDNTPDDLQDRTGITFSFMDQAASIDIKEGIELIILWCKENVSIDRERLLSACSRLESAYGIAASL